jgi:hypothetical protein
MCFWEGVTREGASIIRGKSWNASPANIEGTLYFITECSHTYSDGLRAGRPGFDSRQAHEIFLLSTASRPTLGPTQPPIKGVSEAFYLGVKRPGGEADHSPTSSAEVKNGGAIPPLPNTFSLSGASLIKNRDNFTFLLLLLLLLIWRCSPYRALASCL